MKNFSLKVLGAFIFAAGLVVAGVAAPAFAADSTATIVTNPANTAFSPSSNTPIFTATMTGAAISSNLQYLSVGATNGSGTSWGTVNTCPAFGSASVGNEASCGILSIKVNSVETLGEWKVYTGGVSATGMRLWHGGGSAFTTVTGPIEVKFDSGAFVTSAANAIYTFKLGSETGGGSTIDLASAPVTVGNPSETITFNSNGGSGTMANQTSGSAANLTANSFTKSGFTFGGWAATQVAANAGTVFLADGASYNFQSSRTLYAIWTANSSGGSGSSSSSSNSLANTGINSATGISLLAGGLSLALVGAEMFMIARRKRSN